MQTRQKTIHPMSEKVQQPNNFYTLSYGFINLVWHIHVFQSLCYDTGSQPIPQN